MEKVTFTFLTFFIGISSKSFASAGYASDQIEFVGVLLGFLLLIAGLLAGKDFIRKNGKSLAHKTINFIKKEITVLRSYLNQANSGYTEKTSH